ncbi:TraB/GumN family protein [Allopontixanthobacter sediminis]|uniref:TraB/GumN family protein n=1 Tax=Allopontixanthobacter sediminis TaxID=1689985 RepID=A0A845AVU8_9SPHN|nr:TraB/GumN family protein [Allopontixanthobacter sediminis]MXP43673.1 TraB/GumN family protein [Allopontixanthobacter sediminis]
MRPFLSAALALACALGLAACGEKPAGEGERTDEQAAPLPAMWELASADGTVEGWLFGTIHSLPDGTTWETELISDAVDDADLLIVEIAALEDSAAISHVFARLARTEGLPPLSRRLPAGDQAALRDMLAATSYSDSDFTATESWAAALMLAQGVRGGNPENGVDRALLRRFEGRPVRELEGAVRQLGIFDTLPESDQRDLLAAVVKQGRDTSEESARLAQIWRSGDMDSLARENSAGLLSSPQLRTALLVSRNEDWADQLDALLPAVPPALIAVGAAHMAGPEGLPSLMEQRGYTVTRVQ